jgi:hypothetical protein
MNVNDELQILRKKVVMNQFNVLYKNDSGRAEINTKYFNQASPYPGQDYHQQPPICKAAMLSTHNQWECSFLPRSTRKIFRRCFLNAGTCSISLRSL